MKKNLLLLLVLAGLGAFVYFYEIKGGEERKEAEALEESLLRVEDSDISGIEVRRPESPTIDLDRSGDRWRLTGPVQSSVDRFVVDALVRDLTSAKRIRALEDVEGKLEEFGLSEPRMTLAVEAGDRELVVNLGDEDYTGSQIYAQLEGEDKVFITSKSVFTSADKPVKDWRSKTVLDYNQEDVQVVELERPEGSLRLEKTEGRWRITEPIEDLGDESVISSLLSTVKYARIEDFVVEEAEEEDLAEHGLNSPTYELKVKLAGGDQWQTLQLGEKTGEQYYARDPSRRNIFTVRASLTDNLDKPVDDFRDKKIIDVKQADLDRVVVQRGDNVIEIRREGDGFVMTRPEAEKGKPTAPYKFWYPITDIRFEQLDDGPSGQNDPRFQAPDIRLEVTTRDGATRAYEFVKDNGTHRARKVDEGRSGTISLTDFEKLKLEAPSLATPSQG